MIYVTPLGDSSHSDALSALNSLPGGSVLCFRRIFTTPRRVF